MTNSAVVCWASESSSQYSVWGCLKLSSNFALLQSNIVATPPVNSYTDAFSRGGAPQQKFYRVQAASTSATTTTVPTTTSTTTTLGAGPGSRQQSVTVNNTTAGLLTDYIVRVVIGPAQTEFWATAQAGGADMALTAADHGSLPYYVESFSAADQRAVAWVRVPQIPASGAVNILLLWGAGVTSSSSGKATFPFFEDFSQETDLSGWTQKLYNGQGQISLVGGWARVATQNGDFGLQTGDSGAGLFAQLPDTVGTNFAVDVRFRQQNWDTGHHGANQSVQIRENPEANPSHWWMVNEGDALFLTSFCFEGAYQVPVAGQYNLTNVDRLVVRLTRAGSQYAWWASEDLGETFTKFGDLQITTEHRYIGLCDSYMSGYTEYGWVRMRPLAASEPTVTFGAVQTN
jgi:hypothetical protein